MIPLTLKLGHLFSQTRKILLLSFKKIEPFQKRPFTNDSNNDVSLDTDVKSLIDSFNSDLDAKKRVFILQPRMQYKSKTRQSMNADFQLEESIGLIKSLNNWNIVDTHIVSTKNANKKAIWGTGNIEILSKKISSSGANCLFIGIDRLTNLQKETIKKEIANDPTIEVYDRYTIVLKIFKSNARTGIAKLQIALAELDYKRFKMSDKEMFQDLERKIKSELDTQGRKRNMLNQSRRKLNIPMVSVLGYTNNGKTSLIKRLTQDENLQPKNRLFATLDITYHGTKLPNSSINVIFIDTVGFISDIPYNLIDAFKVTLADALESDLFIHVVDATHGDFVAQEKVVLNILKELDIDEKKILNMVTVYNKIDGVEDKNEIDKICENDGDRVAISCLNGFGIEKLLGIVEKKLIDIRKYLELELKIEQGSEEMRYLYKNCTVKEIKEIGDDSQFVAVSVLFDKISAIKFMKSFPHVKVLGKK
jgi:50S ribosomal subunit-associated GTPase HflX